MDGEEAAPREISQGDKLSVGLWKRKSYRSNGKMLERYADLSTEQRSRILDVYIRVSCQG